MSDSTNRWDTRQLATMALLCSLSLLLSFIEFPIFPAAPFLKYDAAFVPLMICAFVYSTGAGIAIGAVQVVIHALITGNFFGAIVNLIVLTGYIAPAAALYSRGRTRKRALIGLIIGAAISIVCAILANLLITPIYTSTSFETVLAMIVPILLPVNAMKAAINSVLIFVLYKSVSNLIKPKKEQVKGR